MCTHPAYPAMSIFNQIYAVSQLLASSEVMQHFQNRQSTYSKTAEHEKYSVMTCIPVICWMFLSGVRYRLLLHEFSPFFLLYFLYIKGLFFSACQKLEYRYLRHSGENMAEIHVTR